LDIKDIHINDLTYTYPAGVTALRDVSLRIRAGESVTIIGQNGSGKTTLAKHLNGLLKPTSGSVRVGDIDTRQSTVAQLAALVGYVFQNPDEQLFASTVRSEVMFGPKNLGLPEESVISRSMAALDLVGLKERADVHPYDLSLGNRKRVAIASVLAMDTPVIVLDEPTIGQDHTGVELIGQIVDNLISQGKTVITITHDMDFCAEHFERVVVMMEGKILLNGSTREVLAQADVLMRAYVEPPQISKLATKLGIKGVPLSVDEFVDLIIRS